MLIPTSPPYSQPGNKATSNSKNNRRHRRQSRPARNITFKRPSFSLSRPPGKFSATMAKWPRAPLFLVTTIFILTTGPELQRNQGSTYFMYTHGERVLPARLATFFLNRIIDQSIPGIKRKLIRQGVFHIKKDKG